MGFWKTASNVKGVYRREFPVVKSTAFDKRSPQLFENLQIVRIVEPEGGVPDKTDFRLSQRVDVLLFLLPVRFVEVSVRGSPGNFPQCIHINMPINDAGSLFYGLESPRVFARRDETHMPLWEDSPLYPGNSP